MRTIAEAREDVAKCWGTQRLKKADYRPILYLVRTECEEGTLVLNTVTGQMVLLTADELTALDALPGPLPESLLPLMEAHFVVPMDFDEKKSVNQLRALLLRLNRKKEITSYTILPTTACNARCFYCYEANYAHHTMTEETANQVVEFIGAHCGPDKKVGIRWFGGEPMVGMARIDQICEGLQKKGIEYRSSMVSNGYLFNRKLAEHAKISWNLQHIQITLDGTEEVYNKAKAYVNVTGSPYKRVLDNIGSLLEAGIKVSIRMNMDQYNADNLKALIAELATHFSDKTNLNAYCNLLFENQGFIPTVHSNSEIALLESKCDTIDSLLHSLGFKRSSSSLPYLRTSQCMADNDQSVVINPLGGIGKCEHYVYEHVIGDLSNDKLNSDVIKSWKSTHEWPKCNTCHFYPNCVNLIHCDPNRECRDVNICRKTAKVEEAMRLNFKGADRKEDETQDNCF